MKKSLQKQIAEITPSLRLNITKTDKTIPKVSKSKHHSKEIIVTKKNITRAEKNEQRIKDIIDLSELGRRGKEKYCSDLSDTLDYIDVARINRRISIIDEFFCLYALRGAINSRLEQRDDL